MLLWYQVTNKWETLPTCEVWLASLDPDEDQAQRDKQIPHPYNREIKQQYFQILLEDSQGVIIISPWALSLKT